MGNQVELNTALINFSENNLADRENPGFMNTFSSFIT